MWSAKQTALIAMLICAGLVPVCSARTARRTAKRYSAKELIAKIIESERRIHDVELHYDYIIMKDGFICSSFDWGYEGGKEYYAGQIFARANREWDVPAHEKEKKVTFDGEKFYILEENLVSRGGQMERRGYKGLIGPLKPGQWFAIPRPTTILGYDMSRGRRRSFGEILRGAPKALVRRRPEVIDGHPCRVLEAIGVVDRKLIFDVRAWIDTERDFRPLRIEKYHSIGGRNRWQILACKMEKIKLEKIDGVWFPVDGTALWFFTKKILPPEGMTEADLLRLPEGKWKEVSKYIQVPNEVGPVRLRAYTDTVRINKGIDPGKFTIEFPTGCGVLDDFTGMVYTVGDFDDPTFQPTTEVGKILKALKDREVKVEPELTGELVDVLRSCDGVENKYKCFAAIRALIQIGSPAVPYLVAELKRTEKAWTQKALAFILRAIGDASAVDALIDAFGTRKIDPNSGGMGDFGRLKCDLRRFIKRHQIDPSDPFVGLDSRVREITIALEKLTGHSEGHEHFYRYDEKGNRVYVYLDTPENRARTRKMHQAVAQRWRLWWEKNKQTVLKRDAQNRLNR